MAKRKYNVSNSELFEFAGTALHHLDEDIHQFKQFDPDLNEAKVEWIASLYQQSINRSTDQEEKARITKKTVEFQRLKDRGRELISHVRYFVEKKFSDRKGIQDEFGLKKYKTITGSQAKFIKYMLLLSRLVDKYREPLLQSGLAEDVLNEIKQIAQELARVNTEQEVYKNTRKLSTIDRNELNNRIYDALGDFSDAAAIVFSGDPVRRQRYVLPNRNSQSGNKKSEKEE